MLIGESPGEAEDLSGLTFQGETGNLLNKMLMAIDINKKKIYSTYSVNFRPPDDRKPTTQEIKRYSIFLKEHVSIINPKIIILMGSTAMESMTGINDKISSERGNWKEIKEGELGGQTDDDVTNFLDMTTVYPKGMWEWGKETKTFRAAINKKVIK